LQSPERLACKRNFAAKVSLTQYADCCFLASVRDHGEFYLARLYIKHRIREIPLGEDRVFLREKHKFPALADGCEECLGIEIASPLATTLGLMALRTVW
jgi:hypothetical protein